MTVRLEGEEYVIDRMKDTDYLDMQSETKHKKIESFSHLAVPML